MQDSNCSSRKEEKYTVFKTSNLKLRFDGVEKIFVGSISNMRVFVDSPARLLHASDLKLF